jgi:hypothetical protein
MKERWLPTGLAVLVACASAALATACSSQPSSSDKFLMEGLPPLGSFSAGVGLVFERHCASLDCHGQVGRPLRLYSANGLRRPNDAGLVPGGGPTTTDEQNDNYRSIIAIEPEKMSEVVKAEPTGDPFQLLILKKPLNLEAHKGGAVMRKDDDTSTCLQAWFGKGVQMPDPSCLSAANYPPP